MAGYRLGGARTLPILAGERISVALAAGFAVAAVALSYFAPFGRIVSGYCRGGGPVLPALRAENCSRGRNGITKSAKKRNGSGAGGFLAAAIFP